MSGVLVLGSVNVDLVIRGERLPRPGETVIGGTFLRSAGGKGANQAVAAARAGAKTAFIAAVGDDDFGRDALTGLTAEGIDVRQVHRFPSLATGTALILVDRQGENLISVAGGANDALRPEHLSAVPAGVFTAAAIFLAGLETPADTVHRGLERARAAGLRTILNPAPVVSPADCARLLPHVDVVIPNEHEAAALTGIGVDSVSSAVAAAGEIRRMGAKTVIVTLGPRGVVLAGESVVHFPAHEVVAVDTTAAGDAFCGAFAAALAENLSVLAAVRFANAAAALSVGRAGAQPSLPTRDEIEGLLRRSGPGPQG